MDLIVGIPVVTPGLAEALLESIYSNTVKPKEVLILDNTETGYAPTRDSGVSLYCFKFSNPLKVNASWNFLLESGSHCEYFTMLNDDIVLGEDFFERTINTLRDTPHAGFAVPAHVRTMQQWEAKDWDSAINYEQLKWKEGWAWTARRALLDVIPPIPTKGMETFCGDDYLWHWSMGAYKKVWVRDKGNVILHYVGQAVRKRGVRHDKKKEWMQLLLHTGQDKRHANILRGRERVRA